MTTKDVHFFYVPGTGESYQDDTRTEIDPVSMGYKLAQQFGERVETHWVGYDSTIGVAGGSWNGASHYASRNIGKAALLAQARATTGYLIFSGYSQGAGVVFEVQQELHRGMHPDLWDRVIGFVQIANPYRTNSANDTRNKVTITPMNQSASATPGWGVANRYGSSLPGKIPEFELVITDDMICNAKSDSLLREVADMIDFWSFGASFQAWKSKMIRDLLSTDWIAVLAASADIQTLIARVVNVGNELEGYLISGKHVGYGNPTDFPMPLPRGGSGTMTQYMGQMVDDMIPDLITMIPSRGPNPPVVAVEDFATNAPGWKGFHGGNLIKATTSGNRAGIVDSGSTTNPHGIFDVAFPSAQKGKVTITLGDVLISGQQLDAGTNGSAFYIRLRTTPTFGEGTCVEFRVRASGQVTCFSLNGTTATQREQKSGTFTFGHRLSFDYDGNVYTVKNETTGVVILQWTDTGHVVNETNTNWGATQTSNRPFAQPQWSSYTFDQIVMTDTTITV